MATAPVMTAINNDSGIVGDFITNDATLILSGTGVNGERVAIRYYAGDRPTDDLIGPFSNSHYADSSKWALVSGGIWSLDLSDTSAFTSDPPPTITPTAITMVEGANTIYAYSFDGGWAGPHRLVITLDTIAPIFTFTGITVDSGLSGTDRITNDTTLVWSGTMSEAGTLLIEHRLIGGPWVTFASGLPSPAGPGNIGPTLPLSDGVREFRITPTDIAGNTGTAVTFIVTTDTAAPNAPAITGITTDSNTPADFITTDRTLIFSGTAEAGSSITLSRAGVGVVGTGVTNNLGVWTVDLTATTLPYATMTFSATATDLAGNTSVLSAARQVVVFPGNLTILPDGAQYFQTFSGSFGDDTIIAGAPSSHNAAHGMYGDDWIDLNGYLNTITGGEGNDVIFAGQGFANVDAGSGNDYVFADGMLNTIIGGAGNDTILGSDGYAYIDAGGGDDAIAADGSNNTILGGGGDDYIVSNAGSNTIHGGAGINQIYVQGWNNVITGGDDANIIRDTDGQVTITVGNGPNSIVLMGWNNNVTMGNGSNLVTVGWGGNTVVNAGNGNNVIDLAGWSNTVTTGSGNDAIRAGMGMSNINSGGGRDQVWVGGSGASRVDLGAGDDVAYTGGAWGDTLIGGTGDDQFVIISTSTIIVENIGEGTDYVWVGVSGYTMADNVEVAYLTANNITLYGNGSANSILAFGTGSVLDGAGGSDQLFGSSNADVFRGGAGDDAIYSMGGLDRYVYDTAAWGHDAIGGWLAGQKLDFTGSGLSFAQLAIASGAGNSSVTFGASTIFIGGAASLTIGDFIF